MSTQLVVASTAFGLTTVVAAIDDGLLPPPDRRILLVTNSVAVPELHPDLRAVRGMDRLLDRFDAVHLYNDVIDPQHPAAWLPPAADLPLWERQLARTFGLGTTGLAGDLHLVLESIQVSPALTLASVFANARIDVYADGLMSYGPTRIGLPATVGARLERLLHLDLVPGLTPVLLTEFGVPAQVIRTETFRAVADELAAGPDDGFENQTGTPRALLLGQHLAAGGILSAAEERALAAGLVDRAIADGHRELIFKPHPSAGRDGTAELVAHAERSGARLRVRGGNELAETWFARGEIAAVYGCFSTGLLTAASLYGIPAVRDGTEAVLRRLRPYENSNRIPAVIVDALLPGPDDRPPATAGIQDLVEAVSYCMQPRHYPVLRPTAEAVLTAERTRAPHYWSRRRLTELDLPGRRPPSRHPVKQALRSVLGSETYRDLGRTLAGLRGG